MRYLCTSVINILHVNDLSLFQGTMLELTYYAARGTCDPIRLLLAEVSASYQENIISGYDFAEIADGVEFGSLPILGKYTITISLVHFVLVDNDLRLVGPQTIFRYLASKYRLHGSNLVEQAKCDMWTEVTLVPCHSSQSNNNIFRLVRTLFISSGILISWRRLVCFRLEWN